MSAGWKGTAHLHSARDILLYTMPLLSTLKVFIVPNHPQ
jgi:hypothetical protein